MTNGHKILIADDSRLTRATLHMMLGNDRNICEAEDGEKTVTKYLTENPDILLLDLNMPQKNGLYVIDQIRNKHHDHDTFIIVLTGEPAPDLHSQTLNTGANDFLRKPFDKTELLARVGVAERHVSLTKKLRGYTEQIQHEIKLVASLQEKLLPAKAPQIPGVRVDSHYHPSGHASGDYFDYMVTPDNKTLRAITADVSGHGARAAFIMGIVRTLFRTSRIQHSPLNEVVLSINEHLLEIIGEEDDFVTLFALDINFSQKTLHYINAGHCPGMLQKPDGTIQELPSTAPLLGFFKQTPDAKTIPFEAGSQLLLFTDGLYDWRTAEGTLFDLHMFWELAAKLMQTSDTVLDDLMEALALKSAGGNGFRDDQTALWITTDAHIYA